MTYYEANPVRKLDFNGLNLSFSFSINRTELIGTGGSSFSLNLRNKWVKFFTEPLDLARGPLS